MPGPGPGVWTSSGEVAGPGVTPSDVEVISRIRKPDGVGGLCNQGAPHREKQKSFMTCPRCKSLPTGDSPAALGKAVLF